MAIRIIFITLMLAACSSETVKIHNDCIQTVVTYKDAIDCMIQLDKQQYQ